MEDLKELEVRMQKGVKNPFLNEQIMKSKYNCVCDTQSIMTFLQ